MKKLFSLAVIALAATTMFTSCKKDYTCTCTYNNNGTTTTLGTTTIHDTKSNADKACSGANAQWAAMGAGVSCHI